MESSEGNPIPEGASVTVMGGFYEGLQIPVDRAWLVIGRGRSADVTIAEPTISRAHAALGYDGARFFLQDLGSTNGSRRNGARSERSALAHGDQLQLGRILLRVTLP